MIKIIYFASIREKLGLSNETIALPDAVTTLGQLISWLQESRGSIWVEVLGSANTIAAVNQEMAGSEQLINDGDEVAFFPPVTGG